MQSEVDGYRNPTKSGGWRSIPYHSARSGKQPFQPWLCRTTNHRCRPVRFLADGPAISDELLVARDEGRVIFFCGAGVSRARAGLADFFGLARQVLDVLEPNPEARTRKLLEAAIRVQDETGISGLVPADRIFGLLEQDFNVGDIQEAVAKALKPLPGADISAHRTLLELSMGPDGHVSLVTTNFDLLFEAANPGIKSFSPRRLPDPRRPDDLAGITHIHGRVTDDYCGAADDGFVLSSSEFGHAYISDGWATKFIATLLEKYIVVFVGYTADDPPVQYLLEALNRNAGSRAGLYASSRGPVMRQVPAGSNEVFGQSRTTQLNVTWPYGRRWRSGRFGQEILQPGMRL
jgi:hypothetical protein